MKKSIILILMFSTMLSFAQELNSSKPLYPTYKGLIMSGYQGWFRADGDGTGSGWGHYGRDGKFDPAHNTIDFWPDVSEYEKTYETEFTYKDGTKAKVFSSADQSTTDLHFKWMKEYGVDGVFMQRFFRVARGGKGREVSDKILKNAFTASQKYERAISVCMICLAYNPGRMIVQL